jgi:hypothetical protein
VINFLEVLLIVRLIVLLTIGSLAIKVVFNGIKYINPQTPVPYTSSIKYIAIYLVLITALLLLAVNELTDFPKEAIRTFWILYAGMILNGFPNIGMRAIMGMMLNPRPTTRVAAGEVNIAGKL